jgi:uncharacterized protein YbjQ (UPF0145 family)
MSDLTSLGSPAAAMLEAAQFLAAPPPETGSGNGGASDLSIDAVLLLRGIGWEAVELVTGISWQSIPKGAWLIGKGENATVTAAHQAALDAAERQLVDQCANAGGHGVVGVRLELTTEKQHVVAEFVGTAIRPIGARALAGRPFSSDLSARDFVVLTRAGWWPIGFCVGTSFVFVPRIRRGGSGRWIGNFELANYTRSLYAAREQAMERIQSTAVALGATGIVGTTISEGQMEFAHHALKFVTSGTAVALRDGGHASIEPIAVLALDDPEREFNPESLRAQSATRRDR